MSSKRSKQQKELAASNRWVMGKYKLSNASRVCGGGGKYAFFVRTGDIVKLTEPSYAALTLFCQGVEMAEIAQSLVVDFGKTEGLEAFVELDSLLNEGYLVRELAFSDKDIDGDVMGLMNHQPRNLMFLVTEACNLACTYCYELGQGVHSMARTMKQSDAREILDAYFEGSSGRDALTVTFFGGEPLLNFKVIKDAVEYCKGKAECLGKSVDYTLTTNLTLMTEEMAEFFAANKFHVMVSLDGDKEGNDRYRKTTRGEGTYDRVVANLEVLIGKMKDHKTRLPKIRATLTAENSDAEAVEAHLRSLGTHLVMVGASTGTVEEGKHAFDLGGEQELSATQRKGVEMLHRVNSIVDRLAANPLETPEFPNSVVQGLKKIHGEVTLRRAHAHARPALCGVCRNMKAVTPSGDIYPCHRYVGMPKFKLGNLINGGVDEAKIQDYYRDLYRNFQVKCVQCWARHLCGGQCPWTLATSKGGILPPDDEDCDRIRESYTQSLGLYAHLLDQYPAAFEKLLGTQATALTGGKHHSNAPDEACSS